MRVLLDISWLGLGHLYPESRTGSVRAHRQLAEALVSLGDCEVLLCANCSSVAYAGCVEYLRDDPLLGGLTLVRPPEGLAARLRPLAGRAHAALRATFRDQVIPTTLRAGARWMDGHVHRAVCNTPDGVDVFHSPGAPLPRRTRRSPPRLLTIYDLVHPRYAHLYQRHREQSIGQVLATLHPRDRVITTSQATLDDLVELGVVTPDRAFVIPLAANASTFFPCDDGARITEVRSRLGIPPGPYFLTLGIGDARKNPEAALRAFVRLVQQERGHDLTLVLAGPAGAAPARLEAELREAHAAGARVVIPGFVADADLAPLYSGALGFLCTSLHEGFGLPPLEAMQCGTPVIASSHGSVPEVVQDAALVLDPLDGDALSQAMLDLYRDASLRERLRERGLRRAAQFSWERTARETAAAYRTAWESREMES
jgi:glycosyltransferase involved in cell wall biosynthesis